MPLNPSGAISLGGPVTGQSIAVELGLSPTASISLNGTDVRTLAQVPSGTIIMPTNFWGKSATTATQRAIFAYGSSPPAASTNTINLVSNTGVLAGTTSGAGTSRVDVAGSGYGGDKAIFGYGFLPPSQTTVSMTNLVSNTGVVSGDTPGVGQARFGLAAAGYGGDKAIFGYGQAQTSPSIITSNISNLVSNTGVVASNSPGVGTIRTYLAAASYGGDKALFGYGNLSTPPTQANYSMTNLVSNTGVVSSDTPGVGTARSRLAAASYGGDKAIFGYGGTSITARLSMTNLVSNTGVVSSDTPGVGTARTFLAAAGYGGDKAIFGFGNAPSPASNITNLVSNTGVVSGDSSGIGSIKFRLGAAGYSST